MKRRLFIKSGSITLTSGVVAACGGGGDASGEAELAEAEAARKRPRPTPAPAPVEPAPAPVEPAPAPVEPAPAPSPADYPAWVNGQSYAAGAIVRYTPDGLLYIAKFANPGYNPTISTYYWAPYVAAAPSPAPAPAPADGLPPSIPVAASPNFWLQTGNANDAYWVEDNRWGQGSITEGTASTQFEQKVGVSPNVGPNGEVAFRLKWRWPSPPGSNEVKGFPTVLSGRKPGYASSGSYVNGNPIKLPDGSISSISPAGATPGTVFPLQLPLQSLKAKATIKHLETPTGKGHLTYDIWLQSSPKQDTGFVNSSITHEIMIPLTNWGGYGAHNQPGGRNPGWYDHTATIGGREYHVYVTKKSNGALDYDFGYLNGSYGRTGWKMIAFVPAVLPVVGEIDVAALINYIATRKDAYGQPWATGKEYLSSVELGVEPEVGTGDITVYDYRVTTR